MRITLAFFFKASIFFALVYSCNEEQTDKP